MEAGNRGRQLTGKKADCNMVLKENGILTG